MSLAEPLFVTCSYREFLAGRMVGIPVQASNGRPKFPLGYDLAHQLRLVYPPWRLMKVGDPEVFRKGYRHGLYKIGVARIRAAAQQLRAEAGCDEDVPLALLCFEHLPPGRWCHRSMFAGWWEDQTGELVPELGGQAPGPYDPR